MAVYDFFLSRNGAPVIAETYVGHLGRLFYDDANGVIKLSDGVTPGGLSIPYTIATDTVVGGIKAGPGIVINSEGQLLIDSEGLEFSFGDFQGTVGTYAEGHPQEGDDYALLGSIKANEDIVIASNGTGIVKVIGDFSVRTPNSSLNGALLTEPIFRVSGDGQIRMLVPNTDSLTGAVEIIGSDSGQEVLPAVAGVMLHITGNNDEFATVYNDGVNNFSNYIGRRYNGTAASPTQVLSGNVICRFSGTGYGTTVFPAGAAASISMVALENFTDTQQGAKIEFLTAPVGGLTRQLVASVSVADGVSATKFITSGTVSATGNITGNSFIGDGSQLTDLPPPTVLSAVASTNVVIADSLVATTITNMTLTPPAGTYLATFNSQYTAPALGSVTAQAAEDLATLYAELKALPPTVTNHASTYGNGETLGPGVYTQAAATTLAGTLTLNGTDTDIFVFRIAGTLTANNNATIVLTGGAVSSNVWWITDGAITTGNNVVIRGSLLANQAAVNTGSGTSVQGRLLTVNGAIGIVSTILTAPTGTSVLNQGSIILFSIFAAIGALTNSGASTIALSIGTNDGTITGFSTATVSGEIYPAGSPDLAVISYGIFVDGVLIANSKRGQTQTRLQSGWPMTTQTIATVTAGQTVDVRATVPIGAFDIGPGMSLILIPVSN
jgi:hypothetical protein